LKLKIDSEKIIKLIGSEINRYESAAVLEEFGKVIEAGDGIAKVSGLSNVMSGEMVQFPDGVYGVVLNLEKDSIGVILLGDYEKIQEGNTVKSTGNILQVPAGEKLIGRVVDSLGNPVDDNGPLGNTEYRPVEFDAPGIVNRQPVNKPLQTGIKAIDSMIPVGRGQRELVIGDRSTGKTAILADTIINQKGKDVFCIYVAIGQKTANIRRFIQKLEEKGAMEYTIIVDAAARTSAPMQYIAPYSGCAIGEYFLYNGKHALVMYDDLSKHAVAYRQLSLLLKRLPGREAYPGDIFYLHSRLLERSASLSVKKGGGSLTAIPVVETKSGDMSAYIPTNIISITDGQIYLETDLFNAGVRPAINPGVSVSRVGGNAQINAMKKVAGKLRLGLAQFRELETFAKFGTDLDKETKKLINRGKRTVELLKQPQFMPMDVIDQVLVLFSLINGFMDDVEIKEVQRFEKEYLEYMHSKHSNIVEKLKETSDINNELEGKISAAVNEFKTVFK